MVTADLGLSPVSNAFLTTEQLASPEDMFPLKAWYCISCHLVQLQDFQSSEDHFNSNYAYFSSFSSSWLEHTEKYVEKMISGLGLDSRSSVVEVASNDGYLLQFFKRAKIPVLGIEPSANVAKAAEQNHGIQTVCKFFGQATAKELREDGVLADLMVANNVLAHVPDIKDFVTGFKTLLAPTGTVTFEFPHLLNLIEENQFDTIYHEHYSYLSLTAVEGILRSCGLMIYDVEEVSTHGGSLRPYVCHVEANRTPSRNVTAMLEREGSAGLLDSRCYTRFQKQVTETKTKLVNFLQEEKSAGNKIICYGAPAKGNTLLNYCDIGKDIIDYTVDLNPHKQGLYLPGSHIPILAPEEIYRTKPDLIVILPWNLVDEITSQLSYVREWGGRFVIPIPEPIVVE